MRCPTDGGKLLPHTLYGFEIDVCEKCSGIWYDEDELGALLKNLGHWELPKDYQIILSPKQTIDSFGKQTPSAERVCPRDGNTFSRYQYAVNSGIHINRCLQCKGIWLDGGDLDRIREFLKPKPEMQALAKAIAEHQTSSQEMKEMIEHAPLILLAPLYLIPYTTDVHGERFPWITTFLAGANILIFFLFVFGKEIEELVSVFLTFGFVPAFLGIGKEAYRLLTHMFLHVDMFHLLGNMLILWVFARNLERRFGVLTFGVLYIFSGIIAVLVHTLLNQGSVVPAVGASGAISGVLGGYFLLFPSSKIKGMVLPWVAILGIMKGLSPVIKVPAWYYLGGWLMFQLILALLYSGAGIASDIAFFAHVGGFFGGLAIAKIFQILHRSEVKEMV